MSVVLIASIPVVATLFETKDRIISFIIFCLPKILEGLWDLLYKLGLPFNFNHCYKFVYAISMAFCLLLVKNYENDIPSSNARIMKMIYKEIN